MTQEQCLFWIFFLFSVFEHRHVLAYSRSYTSFKTWLLNKRHLQFLEGGIAKFNRLNVLKIVMWNNQEVFQGAVEKDNGKVWWNKGQNNTKSNPSFQASHFSVGLFCEVGAKNIEFDLQRDSEFFAYLTVVDAVVKLQLFSLVWNLVHSSFKFFWLTFHEESSGECALVVGSLLVCGPLLDRIRAQSSWNSTPQLKYHDRKDYKNTSRLEKAAAIGPI